MAPEGVVNALRRIHEALVPGGVLLDLHPVLPFDVLDREGRSLGYLDGRRFSQTLRDADAGLAKAVELGLFAQEVERRSVTVERYADATELIEDVSTWDGWHIPRRLERRIRAAKPPLDVRQPIVLRRLRVI